MDAERPTVHSIRRIFPAAARIPGFELMTLGKHERKMMPGQKLWIQKKGRGKVATVFSNDYNVRDGVYWQFTEAPSPQGALTIFGICNKPKYLTFYERCANYEVCKI